MKLWEKNIPLDEAVERFTVGRDPEFDLLLAPFDVLGSIAHATMLREIGVLEAGETEALIAELRSIYDKIVRDQFLIDPGMEDVHSQVEFLLTSSLGDTGKKIHTGRSRNDQVLLDLKMYFREAIFEIVALKKSLFGTLINLAKRDADVLMPGYTHMQAAMPSSFGLWWSAYAENTIDDLRIWQPVFDQINQNPLGSGAGYGSSLPLNRTLTTELLGFADLHYNVVHAQMSRPRSELFLSFALAASASNLSKLAMDICLFNSQDLAFITIDDSFTTGSSIMPHKKNPDVFEIMRARCNAMMQLPGQLAGMLGHLPSGYHRDFQLGKEYILPALENLKNVLEICQLALRKITVKKDILEEAKYQYIYSVEVVNRLVNKGVPFRDAYKEVSQILEKGDLNINQLKLEHTHEGSLGNLCLSEIDGKFKHVYSKFDFSYRNKLKSLITG